jgi:hypothetical protein
MVRAQIVLRPALPTTSRVCRPWHTAAPCRGIPPLNRGQAAWRLAAYLPSIPGVRPWTQPLARHYGPLPLPADVLLSCLVQGEDTLADVIKKTDMSNADAVYALAEWCAEHNKPTTARQYYGKCIEIDKDHEAAR